ncbi:MAG TPA: hypothetical protein DEO32_03765 [Ruminococcaceae bacterium]|nr:hypothetical protein [Oscillospiraceae bacterium]
MEDNSLITYDENWRNVSEPEYITAVSSAGADNYNTENKNEDKPEKRDKHKDGAKPLLITIQLLACLIVAAAAFVIKGVGGELYDNVRNYYYTELNRALIFDGKHEFDLSGLFTGSTADEA